MRGPLSLLQNLGDFQWWSRRNRRLTGKGTLSLAWEGPSSGHVNARGTGPAWRCLSSKGSRDPDPSQQSELGVSHLGFNLKALPQTNTDPGDISLSCLNGDHKWCTLYNMSCLRMWWATIHRAPGAGARNKRSRNFHCYTSVSLVLLNSGFDVVMTSNLSFLFHIYSGDSMAFPTWLDFWLCFFLGTWNPLSLKFHDCENILIH